MSDTATPRIKLVFVEERKIAIRIKDNIQKSKRYLLVPQIEYLLALVTIKCWVVSLVALGSSLIELVTRTLG